MPWVRTISRKDSSSVVRLIQDGKHLHQEGIREILHIRKEMNDGGVERRKYSEAEILDVLSRMGNPQRLYAGKG